MCYTDMSKTLTLSRAMEPWAQVSSGACGMRTSPLYCTQLLHYMLFITWHMSA
jgi:hypothetical protein